MEMTRRELIAAGTAVAAAAVAGAGVSLADAADKAPERVRSADGASILGPRNERLERENPDAVAPPATDAGTLPNLKFSFAAAHERILTGGWARQITVRELPI